MLNDKTMKKMVNFLWVMIWIDTNHKNVSILSHANILKYIIYILTTYELLDSQKNPNLECAV